MAINNVLLGMTAFYNPHPGGSGDVQTRTEYYLDYLRDFSLQKYTAEATGQFIQRASSDQVAAVGRLGAQFQSSIAAQTGQITSGIAAQTSQITSALSSGFAMLSDRLGALEQSQRATMMLTANVAQLLRIPDSEKQRQHTIELGLKFLSNAQHDQDLFKDALEEFLKAEKLQAQDYFVLQKIGMIYLYVPALVDLQQAADYLTRSGKYAAVEGHANSATSASLLTKDPTKALDQQPGLQPLDIARMAAESYTAASRAQYALGNPPTALQLAQKAVKICPTFSAAQLQQGKCAAATGQPALAASSVRTAVGLRPGIGVLAAGDLDLLTVPAVTDLLAESEPFIKLDIPFDPDKLDAFRQRSAGEDSLLRVERVCAVLAEVAYLGAVPEAALALLIIDERPIAVLLQQAWQALETNGSIPKQWQSIAEAIRQGSASAPEIQLFVAEAIKDFHEVVAWGSDGFGETTVPAGLSGVVAMAAGGWHTVALKQDGTVVAWGYNSFGQTTVPAGLSGVVAIAAGAYHTVALKQDGTVVAWGKNDDGQTTVPAGLSGVVAIAAGGGHTVALKQDGTVVAWGANSFGITSVPAGLSGVVATTVGGMHAVALKQDGTVVAWGYNGFGQNTVPAGLSGVVAIAAGYAYTVALKQDGTVVAWGYNFHGQTTVPAGLSGVVAIAAGGDHTVALKQDGTVVAWGRSQYGLTTVPAGLSGVVAIAAGHSHTVAKLGSRVRTEPGSALALQFFKLGCALIAAADGKLSSREQRWIESHLGSGADAEILSLVTRLGPDGIQTELQSLAAQFSPQDKHWLHCRAWQLQDLAGSDGTEAEERDALACVLNACGWCELPESQRLYLLTGALIGPGRAASP